MRLETNFAQSLAAEEISLQLISFLLSDPERLERLVALTGIGQDDLEQRIAESEFQAFVMDYVLEDQSLVLEFAAAQGLRPEALLAARRKLAGAVMWSPARK